MTSIIFPDWFLWLIAGLTLVQAVLSGVQLYYRRELTKAKRRLADLKGTPHD